MNGSDVDDVRYSFICKQRRCHMGFETKDKETLIIDVMRFLALFSKGINWIG